jgi:hypothetical protein
VVATERVRDEVGEREEHHINIHQIDEVVAQGWAD